MNVAFYQGEEILRGSKRAGLVLTLAVISGFAFASQASATDYTNACRNSAIGTNWDQVDVSMSATASPAAPGGPVTLSNIHQTLAVPGSVFVAGYNLGLLTTGSNSIPATLHSVIDAGQHRPGLADHQQRGYLDLDDDHGPERHPGQR